MRKITPFLWFNDNAEEAMNFYLSIFKDGKIGNVSRYGNAGPGPRGSLMMGTFEIAGQELMVLNGGPHFQFTEAISMFVKCKDQGEVDYYWDRLVAGGSPGQCGWLKDKFGLSWQVIPDALAGILGDKDRGRADRGMRAMLQMSKIDIEALRRAADGG